MKNQKKPVNFFEIDGKLSVSSLISAENIPFLIDRGTNTVISIVDLPRAESERVQKLLKAKGINYHTVIITGNFKELCSKILEKIRGKTVVHCTLGESSSVFAVAYLVWKGIPIKGAISLVRKKIGIRLPSFYAGEFECFNYFRGKFLREHQTIRVRASEKRVVRLKRRSLRG